MWLCHCMQLLSPTKYQCVQVLAFVPSAVCSSFTQLYFCAPKCVCECRLCYIQHSPALTNMICSRLLTSAQFSGDWVDTSSVGLSPPLQVDTHQSSSKDIKNEGNTSKTLPEAQRTQGIDSLTWVISPAKCHLHWLQIWPTCNAISIGSNFGHQVALHA